MTWYKDYRLIEDGDGYTVEIYLNMESTEFSCEFKGDFKHSILALDNQIKRFVEEKCKGIKVNTVKLMVGALLVATIPFAAAPMAEAATATTAQSTVTALNTTGVVTASKLNVRTGASTSYAVMHVLWQGNSVNVVGESGNWYKIKLSDGRTGWVSKTYLQVTSTRQQKINTVIATAKSLIGTPYVWGGESLSEGGFDCSGLTQYVFKQVGFSLNRTSADQVKQGVSVSRANLSPGDLVFHDISGDGVVDHVGIYIGNGQMIHSPKTGDVVKTADMTTTYWESRFAAARRIF